MFCFAFGAAVGSFLNVVVLRMAKKESFLKGRSYCPVCQKSLTAKELIPIFSFAVQKGRCRGCKSKISWQYPILELVTGLSFVFAFCALGLRPRLAFAFVLFAVLIELSALDVKTGEIPYHCSIIIAALGLISFIVSLSLSQNVKLSEHIIGLFIISAPFAVLSFLGAMGGGDVQLMAAAGFLLGWSVVPSALIGFITGAAAGIIIKLTKKTGVISFGPYLSIGIAISYLYGNEIIESYRSFLKI
jgi:leader peptidase (prepilin peptidase)/N-methyltransferase